MAGKRGGKSGPAVEKLADGVKYQKGTIVSRTLIDKRAGTVTLFAFDRGEGLSEHTAPYDAMVCVLDGRAEMQIAGREFLAGSGDMVIMPADKPHAVKALTRMKMLLVMVRSRV